MKNRGQSIFRKIRKRPEMMRHRYILLIVAVLILPLIACCKHHLPEKENQTKPARISKIKISFITPENRFKTTASAEIPFTISIKDSLQQNDTLVLKLDTQRLAEYSPVLLSGEIRFPAAGMGLHKLKAEIYRNGKLAGRGAVSVVFYPEHSPENYGIEVVEVYPHDPGAYTQGLVYEKGIIYESTGLRGESTLRKWVPETGKILETLSLPPDLFGEGCTILGDEIYQLTWTSRVGFVYDKNTFEVKKRLKYSTQGWGLTTDGKSLIMSDGSHYIYFLDPEYFSVLSRIEVYDDQGPVKQLNELEYIGNEIWANVYMTDDIVRINPATGAVTARIHCKGLLPNKDYGPETDVLNGIAWDPDHQRLFLTGKKWPKLFVVRTVAQ